MFKDVKNIRHQGDIGLSGAMYYFTLKGWDVCLPITDNQEYDFVVYKKDIGFKTVQVKTSNFKSGNHHSSTGLEYYYVKIGKSRHNATHTKHYKFDRTNIDYLFILTGDGQFWLIPTEDISAKRQLRLGPSYNKYKV